MGFTASVLTLECETISPSPKSNIQVGNSFSLRLCLFWVKIISGNGFPEMRLFGWSGKFYFPEIEIRWPKKNAFDHGNRFTLLFSLQSISEKWEREKVRERERARARERGDATNAISPSRDRGVGRDLATARSRHWSRSRGAGERSERKIRRGRSRDPRGRSVDRDLAFAWSRRWSRSRDGKIALLIAISPSRDRTGERSKRKNLNCVWVFSGLCFPSSFPNTRKYFPENFLKCNQTNGNIFLF